MASVTFTFAANASDESQEQVGDEIRKLPGVQNIGRISPGATKPALRRMWYAEVANDASASDLVTHLRQHDDIATADLPTPRSLT
jgi:hypothetical protein